MTRNHTELLITKIDVLLILFSVFLCDSVAEYFWCCFFSGSLLYLNFASKLACNEKRTATKWEDLEWHLCLSHPFGGLRLMINANKTCYSKGSFSCGSLFVAKFGL
jgi:hypothetical protein